MIVNGCTLIKKQLAVTGKPLRMLSLSPNDVK